MKHNKTTSAEKGLSLALFLFPEETTAQITGKTVIVLFCRNTKKRKRLRMERNLFPFYGVCSV